MRAVRLLEWTSEPVLVEVDDPGPRTRARWWCGSAAPVPATPTSTSCTSSRRGSCPGVRPFTLGHENAGWVHALGTGVTGLEPGQPVAVYGPWGCGTCPAAGSGMENYCERPDLVPRCPAVAVASGLDGGMADLMLVPAARSSSRCRTGGAGDGRPADRAGLTPYHAVRRSWPKLPPGSTAVVIGVRRPRAPGRPDPAGHHGGPGAGRGHPGRRHVRWPSGDGADLAVDPGRRRPRPMHPGRPPVDGGPTWCWTSSVPRPPSPSGAAVSRSLGDVTVVGIAGGTFPFNFFSLPYEVSMQTTYWGSRPELVEVLDLAARGLLRPTVTTVPLGGGRSRPTAAWTAGARRSAGRSSSPRPRPTACGPGRSAGPARSTAGRSRRWSARSPEPGPRPGAGAGVGVRGLPDRPAPGRGRPAPPTARAVPGHEVVGRVDRVGPGCRRCSPRGDRVGRPLAGPHLRDVPVLPGRARRTSARRRRFTGWDVDGGYAEYAVADERYAYRLPDGLGDLEAAPLLCAGIIGYRALRRAELPAGGRLGHLRVRRIGAPDGAGGAGRGGDGPRDDPVGGDPAAGPRARGGQRRGRRRPAARAARRRHPLRPGGHARAPGPRGPRPGRHPGGGRHPPVRHPRPRLPAPPVRGADAAQRHGQHPGRRAGVPGRSPPTSASGCPRCPTPSTGADRALADLAHDRVDGAAVLVVGGWVSPGSPAPRDPGRGAAIGYNDVTE